MRRIQFIEIHEQPWFPSPIRNLITDALQFGLNASNAYAPIAPRLQTLLDSTRSVAIIDLCSGAGGPWRQLSRKLRREPSGFQIWLTDKYPNSGGAQSAVADSESRIAFYPRSVEATKVPGELRGPRTMFTSFHHFAPEEGRAILQNAVDAGEGIGIFEITRRDPLTMGIVFAWVLILCVCTPWIRPFRWSRLLWTYVVPIIPLVLVFDGMVSCLRTYRPRELREMVEKLNAGEYQWEIGEHSTGKIPITYLIGCPGRMVPSSDSVTAAAMPGNASLARSL